MLVKTFA